MVLSGLETISEDKEGFEMKVFKAIAATAAILLLGTAACAAVQLNFSTGSMGGGFYAIGGGLADYVTKNVPGVEVTAVTSGG